MPAKIINYGEIICFVQRNIVADSSWHGDNLRTYSCIGGMAESCEDGGSDFEIYAWGRVSALSSGGEQGGTYGTRMESSADIAGRRRCGFQV